MNTAKAIMMWMAPAIREAVTPITVAPAHGQIRSRNKNYGEASLHFGQLKNNADSVLHSRSGSALGYETDSSYWSGHVGFGHIFDLTDQVASTSRGGTDRASRDLDVYGKYFYTHVGGDSFRAGDVDYQLDDLNSSLLRIGARLNNRSAGTTTTAAWPGITNSTEKAAGPFPPPDSVPTSGRRISEAAA